MVQQPQPLQRKGSGWFKMDLRKMVGINQGRERSDVLLAIMLPAVLMLIASYTNAWAFLGGNFSFATLALGFNTVEAVIRGLFMEAIVFSSFLMVRILCARGGWGWLAAIPPVLVGLVTVTVSAGCGLAWIAKSGQMDWMVRTVSLVFPAFMAGVFKAGLGLLFPIALAIYALYDVRALIHEHVQRGTELGTLAVQVESAEHHQRMFRDAQQRANEKMQGRYDQLADIQAQQVFESAKNGDWSMGLNGAMKTQQLQQRAQTSVTPVTPAPSRQLLPAAPPSFPVQYGAQQQPMLQQPPINAQFGPAPMAHSGGTIPLQMPPQNGGGMPAYAPPPVNGAMPPLPPNPYQR